MEIILVSALAFAFLWFFVMRPQAKKLREAQELQQALAEGDRVVLTSGIFGTIRHMGDKQAVVELAPDVSLTVLRGALLRKVADGEEEFEYDDELDADAGLAPAVAAPLGASAVDGSSAVWADEAQVVDAEVVDAEVVDAEVVGSDVAWPTMDAPASTDEQIRKEY